MKKFAEAAPIPNRGKKAQSPPVADCIDLAERFSRRYRVEYEESYFAQYGLRARVNDPWFKIISCRLGHIYPWGGSTLAAVTDKAGPVARKLARLPGVTVWNDGDDGVTVLFDVSEISKIAKIMHPRRRRRVDLSEAERAEIGRRLAAGRKARPEPVVQITPATRPGVPLALLDPAVAPTGSAVLAPCGDGTFSEFTAISAEKPPAAS